MAGDMQSFIRSMLTMRGQNIDVEEFKAKQQMAQAEAMSKIGQQFMQAGQQLAKGMDTQRQDAMYNALSEQYFGGDTIRRAQAVDPGLQQAADTQAQGMPGFYPEGAFTGGLDELKVRMQLEQMKSQNMARSSLADYRSESLANAEQRLASQGSLNEARLGNIGSQIDARLAGQSAAQANLDLAREREQRLAEQAKVDQAYKTYNATDDKYKTVTKATDAYNSAVAASVPAMQRALQQGGDLGREQYEAGIANINKHYQGAQASGVKFDTPPTFPTYDQAVTIQQKQAELEQYKTQRGDLLGSIFGARLSESEAQEQARMQGMQQEIEGLGGTQSLPGSPERYMGVNPMEAPRLPSREEILGQPPAQGQPSTQATPQAAPGAAATTGGGVATMSASQVKTQFGIDVGPGYRVKTPDGRIILVTQ
jgi:hypothetical protein